MSDASSLFNQEAALKRLKLKKLKEDLEMRQSLPHLYGAPKYKWQKEFIESDAKLLFLTAANQIGKSTSQIKKDITWATSPDLWPSLWDTQPLTFWYLYPSLKVWDLEVRKKWIPEFLPRNAYKDHPIFGWKIEKATNGLVQAINFNSGVSIIGKSYMSDEELLQTGTVWKLSYDEEMPEHLWPELQMRVAATDGYVSGVFTPTLSQKFWHDVMETRGKGEKLKDAHKITASLYDCLKYADGSPSKWTIQRINKIKNTLPDDDEVKRRVYGRFIMDKSALKYPSFTLEKNMKAPLPVPKEWLWYVGIDSGSGGSGKTHPAAITFVAVSPDFKKGRVVEVWRGKPENVGTDDKRTTALDILTKYVELKGRRQVVAAYYDYNDADMGIIAEREGIPILRAEKRHELGEGLLNTLFKNEMLDIDRTDANWDLADELLSLRRETAKNKAKDDCIDSARYAVVNIPWDYDNITGAYEVSVEKGYPTDDEIRADRRILYDYQKPQSTIDQEIEELNDLYEP